MVNCPRYHCKRSILFATTCVHAYLAELRNKIRHHDCHTPKQLHCIACKDQDLCCRQQVYVDCKGKVPCNVSTAGGTGNEASLEPCCCCWATRKQCRLSVMQQDCVRAMVEEGVPQCMVCEAISVVDLDVMFYPCPAGGLTWREKGEAKGWQSKLPIHGRPKHRYISFCWLSCRIGEA